MSRFEPSLPCFRVFFFVFIFVLFYGGWANWCLSNVLFTAAVGLQSSRFEPSLLSFRALPRFAFLSFVLGG